MRDCYIFGNEDKYKDKCEVKVTLLPAAHLLLGACIGAKQPVERHVHGAVVTVEVFVVEHVEVVSASWGAWSGSLRIVICLSRRP